MATVGLYWANTGHEMQSTKGSKSQRINTHNCYASASSKCTCSSNAEINNNLNVMLSFLLHNWQLQQTEAFL